MDNSPPSTLPAAKKTYSRFETEMLVRPDDIDMNQHVHASRYFDYVLAARFDQMERCYGMGMNQFIERGLGWYVRSSSIEYKRPLKMGDKFIVRTWIEELLKDSVTVGFEILKGDTRKVSADGQCTYTLVKLATGRAEKIPPEILDMYSI